MHSPEAARHVFLEGFAPLLSDKQIGYLLAACVEDDLRLTQGSTTTPPPLMCVQDWPCEGGCAMAFVGGMTFGGLADDTPSGKCTNPNAALVGKCEEFFAQACFHADRRLGEVAGCRHFLNWYDDTPRGPMLSTLAGWCREALSSRQTAVTPLNPVQ